MVGLCIIVGLVAVITACNPNQNAQPNSYSNYSTLDDRQAPNEPYTDYGAPNGMIPFDYNQPLDDPYMYDQPLYDQPIPYRSNRGNNFGAYEDGRVRDQDGRIGGENNDRGRANDNGGAFDYNRTFDDGRVRDQDGRIGDEDDREQDIDRTEAQKVADRLVKLATGVEQVNDATAIVLGRYAIVGLDVDAKLDRSKVGSIKYSVAEALKADPKGAYAVVTADPDLNFRLREMRKDIQDGRPIAGIMDELAGIVGRIMPQVPRGVPAPENNGETPRSPERQEETNR